LKNGKAGLTKRVDREPKETLEYLDKLDKGPLVPKCMRPDHIAEFGFTSGHLLPCDCVDMWREILNDTLLEKCYDEELKMSEDMTIDEILLSDQWIEFVNHIMAGEEYAPSVCMVLCAGKRKVAENKT